MVHDSSRMVNEQSNGKLMSNLLVTRVVANQFGLGEKQNIEVTLRCKTGELKACRLTMEKESWQNTLVEPVDPSGVDFAQRVEAISRSV